MTRPALLVDRDGVINADSPGYIRGPAEWIPIPGSIEALARISQAGWLVGVCTNQSGLARGLITADDLEAIHDELKARVSALGGRIDGIFVCPHAPDADCACRKPRPGLLAQAADTLGLNLGATTLVGDSPRDLAAARTAGARPILVRTGHGIATEESESDDGLLVYADLAAAVAGLLAEVPGRSP